MSVDEIRMSASSTGYYIYNGFIYGPRESGKFYVLHSGQETFIYGPGQPGVFHIQYSGDYGYIHGPGESGRFYVQQIGEYGYVYGPENVEPPWLRLARRAGSSV